MIDLFDLNELQSRVERFGRHLSSRNIDCALLTSNQDLFYFTGSVQKGVVIINKTGGISYFVRKNFDRATFESPLDVKEWDIEKISSLVTENWSMPLDITTVSEYQFYKAKLAVKTDAADCSLPLALTKMIKSQNEIELIKKAGTINSRIMEYAKSVYYQGITDIEIQAEIESYAKKELDHQGLFWIRGSNMEASMGLVVTGTDALSPTYTDFPIGGIGLSPAVAQGASGKIVSSSFVVDFIGCYLGYCADSTRTFFAGEPEKKIAVIYSELNSFLDDVLDQIKPGGTGDEVYSHAMKLVEKFSWKDLFMGYEQKVKFIGHGIGTEVNQLPVIAPKQKIPFENNMLIAIEPKIFIPGYGIVGIENTYLVENGSLSSITGKCDNINDWII